MMVDVRQPLVNTVENQRMDSFRRQLPLRIPLNPNRVSVPVGNNRSQEKHWKIQGSCGQSLRKRGIQLPKISSDGPPKQMRVNDTQKDVTADFGVVNKNLGSSWCKPSQPKFQALYQEFESMKEKGLVMLPENNERPGDSDFAGPMRQFMTSYTPTSNFNRGESVNDWSKEAENLLKELTDYETRSSAESRIWKTEHPPCSTLRSGWSKSCDAWSTSISRLPINNGNEFDIHRHIMEINPSPYPGSSPIPSPQPMSNQNSDNDADDEDVHSSAESTVETIGARRSVKPNLTRASTTLDSGYISSSTECDGKREGDMLHKQGLASDSDELSSISTAPSSPRSTYAWEDTRFLNPIRYAFPPPLPPFVTGISAFPLPPPAQLFPPHIQAAAIPSVHPPAFLPGIPPAHRNVAFVTPVPQSYSQPHFLRQRFDAAAPQTVGGTYHKHKPWITDEILEMIAVRDRLYKRMKKHPATDIVDMYKKVRNMVVGMTRNAKRSYEKRMEERVIEGQLKNASKVAESVNLSIASKSLTSRTW